MPNKEPRRKQRGINPHEIKKSKSTKKTKKKPKYLEANGLYITSKI